MATPFCPRQVAQSCVAGQSAFRQKVHYVRWRGCAGNGFSAFQRFDVRLMPGTYSGGPVKIVKYKRAGRSLRSEPDDQRGRQQLRGDRS